MMPRITRKRRPRAIGAYIFAGGFTIGVLKHFDVVAHFENDLFGTQTVNLNFPHIEIHKDLDDWPLAMPCIDFIYANPPCAPWSMAGIVNSRRKTVADWRNHSQLSCVNNAFCLIEEYVPKVWCFESVRRVYTAGGSMLDSFAYRAMDMGYAVSDVFVEASNHGVPQRRPRYFMVCHKVDIEWQAPRLPNNATAPTTVIEALQSVPANLNDKETPHVPDRVQAVLPYLQPGEKAEVAWQRLMNAPSGNKADKIKKSLDKKPGFSWARLPMDRPGFVTLGNCTHVHPIEDRLITIAETKALCGFPQEYRLVGTMMNRYKQLGCGVCPPVAEWLAANVRSAIDRGKSAEVRRRIVRTGLGEVVVIE